MPRRGASRSRTSRCPGRRGCCCRRWVRPRSSPAVSIGTPALKQRVVIRFVACRRRSATTSLVVGLALDPAVPGPVVVGAVGVVLAVGLVVLVVVGDQVAQGEAVVGGDEVDRGVRRAAVVGVQVAGAGQPGGDGADARGAGRARSRAWCRGTGRSTRSRAAGTRRPGSRPSRRPTARRSASRGAAPGPGRSRSAGGCPCRRPGRSGSAPTSGRSGSRRRASG